MVRSKMFLQPGPYVAARDNDTDTNCRLLDWASGDKGRFRNLPEGAHRTLHGNGPRESRKRLPVWPMAFRAGAVARLKFRVVRGG